MRSLEINLILQPPIPGFPGISTYVVHTHYLGLSVLPGRSLDIWRELKNPATTESNTSYVGTSNSMRSCETWSWDLMRLGLIESHENSHLTRVILKKISISQKHMRWDWDPNLSNTPPKMGYLRCDSRGINVTGTYAWSGNMWKKSISME